MTSFLGIDGVFEGLEGEFGELKRRVSEAILASFEVVLASFTPEEGEFSGGIWRVLPQKEARFGRDKASFQGVYGEF